MNERLKVYYGWAKLNKVRKKISISVMYENAYTECQGERAKKTLALMQDTCFERFQTAGEAEDAKKSNRIFTEYNIFFEDSRVDGSLDKALFINSEADKNNISRAIRDKVANALRISFMELFPDYKEPVRQLELFTE